MEKRGFCQMNLQNQIKSEKRVQAEEGAQSV